MNDVLEETGEHLLVDQRSNWIVAVELDARQFRDAAVAGVIVLTFLTAVALVRRRT